MRELTNAVHSWVPSASLGPVTVLRTAPGPPNATAPDGIITEESASAMPVRVINACPVGPGDLASRWTASRFLPAGHDRAARFGNGPLLVSSEMTFTRSLPAFFAWYRAWSAASLRAVGVPTESPQVRVRGRRPPQKPHVRNGIIRHTAARLLAWPS
jgi:hypothetical protein